MKDPTRSGSSAFASIRGCGIRLLVCGTGLLLLSSTWKAFQGGSQSHKSGLLEWRSSPSRTGFF
ncbi:unnamed protein product, partial [Amoebophrya sp. A25]|eukprot:GSA25T00004765001.1